MDDNNRVTSFLSSQLMSQHQGYSIQHWQHHVQLNISPFAFKVKRFKVNNTYSIQWEASQLSSGFLPHCNSLNSLDSMRTTCLLPVYSGTRMSNVWDCWSYDMDREIISDTELKRSTGRRWFSFLNAVLICKGIRVDVAWAWAARAMGIWAAGSWRGRFMLMLGICINSDMFLLLYHRGPFCLWPKPSRPPRLYSRGSFHHESCNGGRSCSREVSVMCLSSRQKTALWGTTGIHKYSSPEKFIEFVVKDLWWAAEAVTGWRGVAVEAPRAWCWETETS